MAVQATWLRKHYYEQRPWYKSTCNVQGNCRCARNKYVDHHIHEESVDAVGKEHVRRLQKQCLRQVWAVSFADDQQQQKGANAVTTRLGWCYGVVHEC